MGFCAQALEHSNADREAMFIKRVAHIEGVQESTMEGWALAEQERSMAKEACQTLAKELDNLAARNDELQKKLDATYQEVVRLRGGDPQLSGAPPRIIINHGT